MSMDTVVSRRAVLAKIGLAFNFVVGAILAVPIVRYLMCAPLLGRPCWSRSGSTCCVSWPSPGRAASGG